MMLITSGPASSSKQAALVDQLAALDDGGCPARLYKKRKSRPNILARPTATTPWRDPFAGRPAGRYFWSP
jgi:hypothetical protein